MRRGVGHRQIASNRKRSRSGDEAADRVARLVRQRDESSPPRPPGGKARLDLDAGQREVVERGHPARDWRSTAACTGRRRTPSVRAPGPCPGRRSPGARPSGRRCGTTDTPGRISRVAVRPALGAPVARRAAARAARRRRRAGVFVPSANSHSARWATIRARGKARAPSASSRPPAWSKWRWLMRHDVDRAGIEAGRAQRGQDRRPLYAAHRAGRARPCARRCPSRPGRGRRRLDQQAVERLDQRARVDLVVDEARHRIRAPARRASPASERKVPAWTSATRTPPPRSVRQSTRVVDGHRRTRSARRAACGPSAGSKSRWNADAVGSDWPWYFEPSSLRAVRPLDRRWTS